LVRCNDALFAAFSHVGEKKVIIIYIWNYTHFVISLIKGCNYGWRLNGLLPDLASFFVTDFAAK